MATYLDYPYTCSEIDKALRSTEDDLEWELRTFLELLKIDITRDVEQALIRTQDSIHQAYAHQYERIRNLNSDMRDAAEKQLTEQEEEIESLKEEINDLESDLAEA